MPKSMPQARPDFSYQPKPPGGSTAGGLTSAGVPPTGKDRHKSPVPEVGGGGDGGGEGGEGGSSGGGGDNGDDNDDYVIIYCYYCGCPWWDCPWCHYWSPMYWYYCRYDDYYWRNYWNPGWTTIFNEFHATYNFEDYYPSIYTPPALILDPTSLSIEYLDEGAELFRSGKYLEALHKFRLATLADLNFAVPKFAYAHALFALGIYDYAAYEIRLGLALLPEWVDMGGDLKLMYGNPDDFQQQLSALKAHLRAWSGDEDALLLLGYVSYFTGDVYLAEKVFTRLKASFSQETVYVADLFTTSIGKIKESLETQGKLDEFLPDDGLTLEEVLQH
jgi:hypothetical protein